MACTVSTTDILVPVSTDFNSKEKDLCIRFDNNHDQLALTIHPQRAYLRVQFLRPQCHSTLHVQDLMAGTHLHDSRDGRLEPNNLGRYVRSHLGPHVNQVHPHLRWARVQDTCRQLHGRYFFSTEAYEKSWAISLRKFFHIASAISSYWTDHPPTD